MMLNASKIKNKVLRKLIASSAKVVLFDNYSKFKNKGIDIPMAHRSEYLDYGDSLKWEDTEYNYRLSNLEDIYYAVLNNKVVGHIGIDDDYSIRAVYVDPEYRNRGISEKMHLEIFKLYPRVMSDDSDAMEVAEKKLWEKLMKRFPDNIQKLEDGSFVHKF